MGRPLHRLPADRRARRMTETADDGGGDRPRRPIDGDPRPAAATLDGVAVRTPLVPFGPPDHRRFLKAESLQPIGAFKIRGAYVAVASLTAEERARGVITYSSGNHAQGVARAARLLGRRRSSSCRPTRRRSSASESPRTAPRSLSSARPATSARAVAERIAAERGLRDHPALRRRPHHRRPGHGRPRDRRGAARRRRGPRPDRWRRAGQRGRGRVKALRPDARVIGVEPELAADARSRSRRARSSAGRRPSVSRTIADGTRTQALGRGRSPTCARTSTASSRSPRRRSRPASGWRPSGAASSPSRRARCPSPRWCSGRRRSAWTASTARRGGRQRRERRRRALPRVPPRPVRCG